MLFCIDSNYKHINNLETLQVFLDYRLKKPLLNILLFSFFCHSYANRIWSSKISHLQTEACWWKLCPLILSHLGAPWGSLLEYWCSPLPPEFYFEGSDVRAVYLIIYDDVINIDGTISNDFVKHHIIEVPERLETCYPICSPVLLCPLFWPTLEVLRLPVNGVHHHHITSFFFIYGRTGWTDHFLVFVNCGHHFTRSL